MELEIDTGKDLAQSRHGRFPAERLQVRADVAMGHLRQAIEVDVVCQRHAARVHLQDLQSPGLVGHADDDLAIEPARPPQGGIEGIGNVRGTDDDDLPARLEPVHEGEQLRDDPAFDLLLAAQCRPLGRDGVDFVDENDARAGAGLLEDAPQMRFALAIELVHDLRAAETEELGVGFVGDSPRDQGLAASRWAVQEDAFRGVDAEPIEDFRIAQRQLDHLADGGEFALQPADILVGNSLRQHLDVAAAAADLDRRRLLDDDRTFRHGLQHGEVLTARAHERGADTVAFAQSQTLEKTADIMVLAFLAHVAWRADRGQTDLPGGMVLRALQAQPFAERHAGIVAGQAVDLHHALAAIIGKRRHRLGNGLPLAGEEDQVARLDAEQNHVRGIDTDKPATDVLRQCFGHLPRHIRSRRDFYRFAVFRHDRLAPHAAQCLTPTAPSFTRMSHSPSSRHRPIPPGRAATRDRRPGDRSGP